MAHISPATCLRRVRRLVESGVIERQMAVVSPDALAGLTAILEVTLDVQSAEAQVAFEALINPDPVVQQCYRVATGPDFVLVVYVLDMTRVSRVRAPHAHGGQQRAQCAQLLFGEAREVRAGAARVALDAATPSGGTPPH